MGLLPQPRHRRQLPGRPHLRLTRPPASVSELARPLDMTLAAVVQHLQVLEASGLVRSEKGGAGPDLPHRAGGAAHGGAVDQ